MIRQKISSIFNQGDRLLKTDTRYITTGGFWLALSQGISMVCGLFLSLAFANLISKESFGTYKFILSITGILGIVSLTEMGTAITRAVAKGFSGALKQGVKINFKWSLGILIGGLIFSAYYFINGNIVLSVAFIFAGIFIPITSSASLHNAYLLGKKDFPRITLFGAIRNIVPALCLIITLFLTSNLVIILLVYFSATASVAVILYLLTLRISKNENQETDPALPSSSKHLSLMEVIGQISAQVDKILIFHYMGSASLAIYAFAIAPVEQLQGGKKILSSLVLPKMSERPFEELQKSSTRKAVLLAIYALGIAGIYAFFAPYFYKIFFPQYIDSVIYSQVYSLTLLAVAGTVFDSVLVSHNKTKELYYHRTIIPITKIILFVTLLPILGLMGLIISHVIIRSFSGILDYYFVKFPFKTKT